MVIPVPTFIRREQIHVADKALIDHLDAYSAPRLVEYFDENPCAVFERQTMAMAALKADGAAGGTADRRARAPWRLRGGAVHGRGIRHPDSVGEREHRP